MKNASTRIMLVSAFAAAKTADNPATTETTTTRAAPVLTAVTSAVPMPERKAARGSKSAFNFDGLTEVGMSFGVKDRTAASLTSVVHTANKKAMIDKTDATGAKVFKTIEIKDANGVVVGSTVSATETEKVAGKHFFAVDCDAKTDPDGASVRIFRDL